MLMHEYPVPSSPHLLLLTVLGVSFTHARACRFDGYLQEYGWDVEFQKSETPHIVTLLELPFCAYTTSRKEICHIANKATKPVSNKGIGYGERMIKIG